MIKSNHGVKKGDRSVQLCGKMKSWLKVNYRRILLKTKQVYQNKHFYNKYIKN